MRTSSQVFLGDMMLCLEKLAPGNEASLSAIAGLLGFERMPARTPVLAQPQDQPTKNVGSGGRRGEGRAPLPKPPDEEEDECAADLGPPPIALAEGEPKPVVPLTLDGDPLPPYEPRHSAPPRMFDPLFTPIWTRSILASCLSVPARTGRIDCPRVVKQLSRAEGITKLPWISRPSLRNGVQVLIDMGDWMQPFRRDQFALVNDIRTAVGRDNTEILYFADCPNDGAGPSGTWSWTKYRPPPTPRPILVLSDLHIAARRAGRGLPVQERWAAWAAATTQHGNRIVAFVPHPASQWPRRLTRQIRIIQWDRSTTARMVAGK